ncbi:microsomal glutathione S-transferase 1-like [Diadema antillarum]|uniref:microsomal glutathione S-transferase 1-like n=1 Tax=Diadema antillarum TaxID=105358 RepID=UPI003A859A0C
MAPSTDVYTLENEIFRLYATYVTIVVLKMMAVALWTSKYRLQRKVFANWEDLAFVGEERERLRPILNDPSLLRIQRCHLNDLENVVPFAVLGLLYVATQPSFNAASLHFRAFALSRFFHTVAYLTPLRQPSRSLAYAAGVAVNCSMAFLIIRSGQF